MEKIAQKYKKTVTIFSILLGIFVFSSPVEASIVSVKAPSSVSVGQRVVVKVLVDPQEESINSIEVVLSFSPKYFTFNGFNAKQSSIPVWIEEPKEKDSGQIYFSGVIPGGIDRLYDPINVDNKAISIVELFFISKVAGSTDFKIKSSQVLKNDGKGTPTVVNIKNSTIAIIDAGINTQNPISKDIIKPESFNIDIIERSVFGKTPKLAVLSSVDSGGIERYEVAVGRLGFKEVTSPVALPYRLFSYSLTARAYDYSGDFQEKQIFIPGEKPYGVLIFCLIFILVLILMRFYSNKMKKR